MNLKSTITIGTRGSELALWQAHHVKARLEALGHTIVLQIIKTKGDTIQDLSFDKLEGKGFFTKELEEALLNGSIDLAVHSHKDLPTTHPPGLTIAAVSEREDPADILLIRKEKADITQKYSLPQQAIVGTSSARRKTQLAAFRSDIELKDIRGNVPTRINKLRSGDFDAIMLAKAGVSRLEIDLSEFLVEELACTEFIPAPAQGVLALQTRESDTELIALLQAINNDSVAETIAVERKILNLFDGGCQLPLGAYCVKEKDTFKVWATQAANWDDIPKRVFLSSNSTHDLAQQAVALLRINTPKQVFITRDLQSSDYFSRVLLKYGYGVIGQSLIETKTIQFTNIAASDWVFFSSRNAVTHFFNQKPQLADDVQFAVIGRGTEAALRSFGIKPDFVGNSAVISAVGKAFAPLAENKSVLFPQAKDSLQSIQKELPHTVKSSDVYVYATEAKKEIAIAPSDVLVFTSPSNVAAYFDLHYTVNANQSVIAIGQSTARALERYGIKKYVLPASTDETGLAEAVFSL